MAPSEPKCDFLSGQKQICIKHSAECGENRVISEIAKLLCDKLGARCEYAELPLVSIKKCFKLAYQETYPNQTLPILAMNMDVGATGMLSGENKPRIILGQHG